MSRYDETIAMLQEINEDIKNKASEKLKGLSEFESDKVNIIADKTIGLIDEAIDKLHEATERITDENELNDFLNKVGEKCVDAKNYAIEKLDEILPSEHTEVETSEETTTEEVNPVEETPSTEAAHVEVKEEIETPVAQDTTTIEEQPIQEIPVENVEIINEELPSFTKEEPVYVETPSYSDDLVDSVLGEKEEVKPIPEIKEEDIPEVETINEFERKYARPQYNLDNLEKEKLKISNSIEELLKDENIKYAAKFVVTTKNEITNFLAQPQTKELVKDLKLIGFKLANKGLDFLVESLEHKNYKH